MALGILVCTGEFSNQFSATNRSKMSSTRGGIAGETCGAGGFLAKVQVLVLLACCYTCVVHHNTWC